MPKISTTNNKKLQKKPKLILPKARTQKGVGGWLRRTGKSNITFGTGTTQDVSFFKAKSGAMVISNLKNQPAMQADQTYSGTTTYVRAIKQAIFTSDANRNKLGQSDQH